MLLGKGTFNDPEIILFKLKFINFIKSLFEINPYNRVRIRWILTGSEFFRADITGWKGTKYILLYKEKRLWMILVILYGIGGATQLGLAFWGSDPGQLYRKPVIYTHTAGWQIFAPRV